MRKIFWGLIFFIFTSVNSFALDQQEAINSYLKGRNLQPLEGIWIDNNNEIFLIYQSNDNKYYQRIIRSAYKNVFNPGATSGEFSSASTGIYYGPSFMYAISLVQDGFFGPWIEKATLSRCEATIFLTSYRTYRFECGTAKRTASKIYPEQRSNEDAAGSSSAKTEKKRGASGSAFFINNKGNIVTNNHVIDKCSGLIKVLYNKKEFTAKVVSKDDTLDLAVLSSDIKPNQYLKLSKKSGDKLDRVVAAGYPLGYRISDELKLSAGIVSATKGWKDNINEFQIDAALNPGNSGGPVVNDAGNLFGVAVAGLADRQNLNFAIKSKAVKDFLDVNKVSYSTATMEFDMDNKKRLKLLEDSTVFIYCN